MHPDYQLGELGGRRESLALREVRLDDLPIFRRWRSDPRYASMLRRPRHPATDDEQFDWFTREAHASSWWTAIAGGTVRGYGMLTPHGIGCAELSVLTDPDAPCDAEVILLLEAEARSLGIRRLFGETYTAERAELVRGMGFQPVAHWTKLL